MYAEQIDFDLQRLSHIEQSTSIFVRDNKQGSCGSWMTMSIVSFRRS
jgi:hypothetical protein